MYINGGNKIVKCHSLFDDLFNHVMKYMMLAAMFPIDVNFINWVFCLISHVHIQHVQGYGV